MAYLSLEKHKLVNLEYSLFKEILRTNRAGSYCSSSIIGCNTRKYHGLLVCPIPHLNMVRHVLLSTLDVTVIQHEKEFNLGLHKYSGNHYEPKGHKYVKQFGYDVIPQTIYRVGGVLLSVETILSEKEEQVLLKYTLLEANSDTKLKLKPFFANRSVHELTHANLEANTKFDLIENGIHLKMYDAIPGLNIQVSKSNEFVASPNWYKDIEYIKEQKRGYEYKEDLYVPGYFEFDIKKGESVIVSASTKAFKTSSFKTRFTKEVNKRIPRDSFKNDLLNAASQFFVTDKKTTSMIAGYHWYKKRLRDTLISLPLLTEALQNSDLLLEVSNSAITEVSKQYLDDEINSAPEADTPLWLFWMLQQCWDKKILEDLLSKHSDTFTKIIQAFLDGKFDNIILLDTGLLKNNDSDKPLTWMNSISNQEAVTHRNGICVDVNALWYNALKYVVSLDQYFTDKAFIESVQSIIDKLDTSFVETFWNKADKCLYDVVHNNNMDTSIRPNQIFTTAFEFSPLDKNQKKKVVDTVRRELLTPKGLRTLSPQDGFYEGIIAGPEYLREKQLHQGTVWPWLMSFYAEGYLKLHKTSGISHIKNIAQDFKKELGDHCLGTLPEYFDGNPPYKGKGAVSMAWNVAGVLKILKLIENYS
ncbi:glycogen debranching enzyme N-terminal domain-containing protein [Saccharicrinis aurantiacus]|uniref:glycogen debranching enzyme N-terminal domain-containing protein n=1 Tax=Saccharicrinis aurantiacus TaxID=1849719 RepID=UPI002491DF43|nr:glycogen debranching enzyme N-terminal domain-containing protein [Saccharicrinis aurantiacus]